MSLLKIKYSASSDLSHPDLSPLFGIFYKVFLDFLTSFLVLKINLCFHKFEPIPENIVHMKSFTDPICPQNPIFLHFFSSWKCDKSEDGQYGLIRHDWYLWSDVETNFSLLLNMSKKKIYLKKKTQIPPDSAVVDNLRKQFGQEEFKFSSH